MSEALKIFPVIQKYLRGRIWDLGCGDRKITEKAVGIDCRELPGVKYVADLNQPLTRIKVRGDDLPDVVFSSHFLEHVHSPLNLITDISMVLRTDGVLVLYLPDAKYYNNRNNPEHIHSFEYQVFMRWFETVFKNRFKIIEHGADWDVLDHYSFYLVAQKI